MSWVEELQDMVHFIIINWFDWRVVWIRNRFRVKFSWKIWGVNLNITVINCMMIKSPHDIWNKRSGFRRICPGFEVRWWRLAVILSWWISWFITMEGVEFIYLYSKTWWKEFRAKDDVGIIIVSNPSTAFKNTLLSHVERCNNWMESFCMIVSGTWRTKMSRALTRSGQCSWGTNNF